MSESNAMSNMKNQGIKEISLDKRRELQYAAILEWDKGKLSGTECIERIVDLEKLVFLDPKIIHGEPNGPKS